MEKKVILLPPAMPNFITYDIGIITKRQEGFKPESNQIPVTSLSRQEAIEYGELMKQKFIEHWEKNQS